MLIYFKITRIYQNNTNHDRVVMSNTVDMTRVEKYFHNLYEQTSCLNSTVGVVEWKMHLISFLRKATKLSSRTSGQVVST